MKKFILSIFVMGSFGAYVILQNGGNSTNNFVAPISTTPVLTSNNTKKSSKPSIISIATPVVNNPSVKNKMMNNGGMMNRRLYSDGTYIGDSIDAYYGNVQVQATISNGRLTNVQALDYPQDRNTSVRINSRAIPILIQEAIVAQSANVDGVSGASATSPAFIQSLMSALDQAKV